MLGKWNSQIIKPSDLGFPSASAFILDIHLQLSQIFDRGVGEE